MQGEIVAFLDLLHEVYRDFGFSDVRVVIATRPEKRLGSDEVWDQSEQALIAAVEHRGLPYDARPGEGAFYGPKIEFHVKDALGRPWQLGTIQVDFNLPERFELEYIGEDDATHRPVMLHRAILGSLERFFAVLIEHVAGAFPIWLAPEQVALLTVSEKVNDYANEVAGRAAARRASARSPIPRPTSWAPRSATRATCACRIRRVVGQREAEQRGVSLRSRDEDKDLGFMPLDALIERIRAEGMPPSRRTS